MSFPLALCPGRAGEPVLAAARGSCFPERRGSWPSLGWLAGTGRTEENCSPLRSGVITLASKGLKISRATTLAGMTFTSAAKLKH